MVLAAKNMVHTGIYVDRRDLENIRELSRRTKIAQSSFMREALRLVILKYKALLDDETLELGNAEAAPAHARLIEQRRANGDTIRPHENLGFPPDYPTIPKDEVE